jgi:ABC-2 type transport system permease protein
VSDDRHRIRSLLSLVYMNGLLPMKSQPLYLVNTLASPLSFLFFVIVASKGALFPFGVTGGMILTILTIGTSIQADLVHFKTDLRFQDVVVASPVEAPVYVAGIALSELVYAIPGLAVFVILSFSDLSYTIVGTLTLAGTLLLVWGFASALGFTVATYFQDIRETFVFAPLISLVMTVLPPVYYPIGLIPSGFRWAAYLSPTTYAADLVHRALCKVGSTCHVPPSLGATAVDWAVLVGLTAALFLLAATKARWREP